MAKTPKTIKEAIEEIINNYEHNIAEAVEYASNKAIADIYRFSMSCLERYYEYDPNSYNRTDFLWRAILPYAEPTKTTETNIKTTVGILYDPSVLEGHYYSGSEKYGAIKDDDGHIKTYGHPNGSWVLENYLKGIHPATNGARDPNNVVYFEIVDDASPYGDMYEYLKTTAPKLFRSRLIEYFIKTL